MDNQMVRCCGTDNNHLQKKRLPNINSFEEDPCLFGDNDYNFWAKSHGTVLPFSIGNSLDPDIAKLRTK